MYDWKKVKRAWRGYWKAVDSKNDKRIEVYRVKLLEIYGRLGIKAKHTQRPVKKQLNNSVKLTTQ